MNLTKYFGDFLAVDGVTLGIPPGGICAFLGPNGAGKSTTVKMLTGLIRPSSGDASIDGKDLRRDALAIKRIAGVLPENLGLFDALTVHEHLLLGGAVYGLSAAESRDRAEQLLRALVLENGKHTFIDHCSYGMRKKTALAMALIHNPRVLFLDEPFEGIDPVTSRTIRDLLTRLAARNVAILLTSHILSVVERLATQIVLIREGRIVWNSAATELTQPLEELYFDLVEAPPREELPWLGSFPS